MPEQQGDKELASFIRRKQDELMGLILKGGLSPTDEKLIYKDLDKLASNALTVAGRSGYSEGGTISKIPSSIKDKFAAGVKKSFGGGITDPHFNVKGGKLRPDVKKGGFGLKFTYEFKK